MGVLDVDVQALFAIYYITWFNALVFCGKLKFFTVMDIYNFNQGRLHTNSTEFVLKNSQDIDDKCALYVLSMYWRVAR